jgi:cell division protein ZapA (FtsZ GTPase activity inhibitor)
MMKLVFLLLALHSTPETVTMQERVCSNMLTINTLVELLDERGLIKQADLLERIKKLQGEMKAKYKIQ